MQRETYNVMDFLGDFGGFVSILNLIGHLVAANFTSLLMKVDIFTKLYFVSKLSREDAEPEGQADLRLLNRRH